MVVLRKYGVSVVVEVFFVFETYLGFGRFLNLREGVGVEEEIIWCMTPKRGLDSLSFISP